MASAMTMPSAVNGLNANGAATLSGLGRVAGDGGAAVLPTRRWLPIACGSPRRNEYGTPTYINFGCSGMTVLIAGTARH